MSGDEEQDQVDSPQQETYEDEFQVERILNKMIDADNGNVFYLIKWLGFDGQDTWEPEMNLVDCADLIKDFEDKLKVPEEGSPLQEVVHAHADANYSSESDDGMIPFDDGILRVGFERGLIPKQILGATNCGGKLCFLIKWKGTDVTDIVSRDEANVKCPHLVIKFYEDRIQWNIGRTLEEMYGTGDEDEEESTTAEPMAT